MRFDPIMIEFDTEPRFVRNVYPTFGINIHRIIFQGEAEDGVVVFNEGGLPDTAGYVKVGHIQNRCIGGVDFEFVHVL